MECPHPMLYKNMCAACGAKVNKAAGGLEEDYSANFAASGGREVHITSAEAKRIEQANLSALLSMKKLSLVLDLDNTLLNATSSQFQYSEEKMKNTHELIMAEPGRSHLYLVKLRPKLKYFLEQLSPLYQMSIYTHGTRKYAEGTCKIMDPDGVYFGRRILSRSDHPELGATKSLAHLLKTDWSMVLIYDDREDVWRKGGQGDHLLCAKPFVHFNEKEKGVLNNAPGLMSMGTTPKENVDVDVDVDVDVENKNKNTAQCVDSDEGAELTAGSEEEEEDEGLVRAVEVFKKLHELYFNSIDTSSSAQLDGVLAQNQKQRQVSIGQVLKQFRHDVLLGCVLCFSGVIPPFFQTRPQDHHLWRVAVKLGARVETEVSDQTTHLLGIGLGNAKSMTDCLERSDVFVAHCDWLLHCHWNVQREDEAHFSLLKSHEPVLANDKIAQRAAAIRTRREEGTGEDDEDDSGGEQSPVCKRARRDSSQRGAEQENGRETGEGRIRHDTGEGRIRHDSGGGGGGGGGGEDSESVSSSSEEEDDEDWMHQIDDAADDEDEDDNDNDDDDE